MSVVTQPKPRKKLASIAPIPTPLPSPTPTPTVKPIPRVDVEIGKPEISEQLTGEGSNQGYTLKRTLTRKFRTPEGKTKTVTTITDKAVSYGFIETKTSTTTDINGILSKRAETKTETEDGTTTEVKDTNEWGLTTTKNSTTKQVSNDLKNTLTSSARSFKADPQIQPDPEPEPQPQVQQSAYPSGMTCADFATYAEAQAALPTNPQLDGNGDGSACESQFSSGGGGGGGSYRQSSKRRRR